MSTYLRETRLLLDLQWRRFDRAVLAGYRYWYAVARYWVAGADLPPGLLAHLTLHVSISTLLLAIAVIVFGASTIMAKSLGVLCCELTAYGLRPAATNLLVFNNVALAFALGSFLDRVRGESDGGDLLDTLPLSHVSRRVAFTAIFCPLALPFIAAMAGAAPEALATASGKLTIIALAGTLLVCAVFAGISYSATGVRLWLSLVAVASWALWLLVFLIADGVPGVRAWLQPCGDAVAVLVSPVVDVLLGRGVSLATVVTLLMAAAGAFGALLLSERRGTFGPAAPAASRAQTPAQKKRATSPATTCSVGVPATCSQPPASSQLRC